MDKWASEHARPLFTTSCRHPKINFFAQDVDFMDQTDPFVCDCKKRVVGLDVTVKFNLGFV